MSEPIAYAAAFIIVMIPMWIAWRIYLRKGYDGGFIKYFFTQNWGVLSELLYRPDSPAKKQEAENLRSHKQAERSRKRFRMLTKVSDEEGASLCNSCDNYIAEYKTCKSFKVGVTSRVISCEEYINASST